jgi:hypothetical protein
MKWIKKGLIYGPRGDLGWARHSALQPTPLLLDNGTIRVYCGFRNDEGVARVGFVDLDADDPSKVLGVSDRPALDVGVPGAFDENGVVPCAIVRRDNSLHLYYAGYQLGQKVKFFVFGGLAVSVDGGNSFERFSRVPVCDRTDKELFFRVIHSIRFEQGRWKVWYGAGDSYSVEEGAQLPNYDIRYTESSDGLSLSEDFVVAVRTRGTEYRVGRPYVLKADGFYRMFYSAGTHRIGYRLAYAESVDGIVWSRKDEEVGITVSAEGWDSEMQAYPAVVSYKDKTYLFYNGNNYGRAGFGYALLEHW